MTEAMPARVWFVSHLMYEAALGVLYAGWRGRSMVTGRHAEAYR